MIEYKIVFWISFFIIFYAYAGYFIFLALSAFFFRRETICDNQFTPFVSMVIAAYNEEKIIEQKLKNSLEIDYPENKIEFIIGSDGSTDKTNEIVEKYENNRIKFFSYKERKGKVSLINRIMEKANGEIIVFSDANTIYEKDAVKEIVSCFTDNSVGGVCGELILKKYKEQATSDEIKYWKYENRLKHLESKFNTVIGATGGIYAIRKNLYDKLPESRFITHDFFTSMNVVKKGFRVVYNKNARAYELSSPSIKGEFVRKVRIAFHNFNGISYISELLNPVKGKVAFQLWSHKILRWFLPFIFLLNLISVCMLFSIGFYKLIVYIYILYFILALFGFILDRFKKYVSVLSVPYYLFTVNFALVVGFIRYIFKLDKNIWKKVER